MFSQPSFKITSPKVSPFRIVRKENSNYETDRANSASRSRNPLTQNEP